MTNQQLSLLPFYAGWGIYQERLVAAIAPLTFFAIIAGVLMTGSVVTESVFSWPGTGLLAIDAVRARDYQVVQAVVIVFSAIFIMTNLLVDILYAYLDPRIRYR